MSQNPAASPVQCLVYRLKRDVIEEDGKSPSWSQSRAATRLDIEAHGGVGPVGPGESALHPGGRELGQGSEEGRVRARAVGVVDGVGGCTEELGGGRVCASSCPLGG